MIGPASRPPTTLLAAAAERASGSAGCADADSLASAPDVMDGCMTLFPLTSPTSCETHLICIYNYIGKDIAHPHSWSHALLQAQHQRCAFTSKHLPRPRLRAP